MMRNMFKAQCSRLAVATAFLLSCSGSGDDVMALAVDNAYCPAGVSSIESLPDVLRVETYRILISGDNFDSIEIFYPGNVISDTIKGIPKGEGRTLLVEAMNKNGTVICRRQVAVNIKGGKNTPINIALLSVPFVTNLSNGNLVTATRLLFKGYGEPTGGIEILDSFGGSEKPLIDLSTSRDLVSPSLSDAGFFFKPEVLPIGPHTFTIRDAGTGESSQVSVILVQPGREPGRGVVSAGLRDVSQTHSMGRSDFFTEVLESLNF